MSPRRRLITIGHSYVVGTNRRLADAMAGDDRWEVMAVAPEAYPGDLAPLRLTPEPGERCRLAGVPVRLGRWPHLMTYGAELRRLLNEPWDVVHLWEEPFVSAAYQVARWTPPGAVLAVGTFQNLPKRYPPPFRWMEGAVMRRADGWVAFGRTVHDALADRSGYRDRPARIIPPGVCVDRFAPDAAGGAEVRAALGWTADGPAVVGFLGRFVAAKGTSVLMDALDRLAVPWRALFVGGGEDEGALRVWAVRHGDRVRIVTGVGHADVPQHLAAMDVLCAPSRTTPRWREQLGRMITEAFACGIPVVGSDSGEIPHVIGEAGIVVPEGDAAALAAELSTLLMDPARRAELAMRGLERARAEYSVDAAARRHLDFFDELLETRRG